MDFSHFSKKLRLSPLLQCHWKSSCQIELVVPSGQLIFKVFEVRSSFPEHLLVELGRDLHDGKEVLVARVAHAVVAIHYFCHAEHTEHLYHPIAEFLLVLFLFWLVPVFW